MRQIYLLLLLTFLLCGCTAAPEVSIEPVSPTAQTAPTESQNTEPMDPLQQLLDAMTLEEKVGQLFLARCPAENAADDLAAYHLGGYLLFGQDFDNETPDSFREKISGYQNASPIPLLIAVDEEGGTVCRVSSHQSFRSQRFPSPREAYAAGGMEYLLATETEKAELLSSLGINVIMGPVCDITPGFGAFMQPRSLGESPEITGRFAASAVQIYSDSQLGSVLKHFPGYGNNPDTHTDMVTDARSLEELETVDLLPFEAGIQAGCDAILMSHNIISALDDTAPASLSPAVHDYLRNTMDFDGVIVTDDLVMAAITQAYGAEEAAVLAVLSGNDLLCCTDYPVQYPAVLEAVRANRISEEQLEESVLRTLKWKQKLGLIF
ncbi:MAG: beta-hexosaminidase [Oscillospiraceae bacterium]|nr:beta-hexosaminidase [Oscillospiraceae bacterium]